MVWVNAVRAAAPAAATPTVVIRVLEALRVQGQLAAAGGVQGGGGHVGAGGGVQHLDVCEGAAGAHHTGVLGGEGRGEVEQGGARVGGGLTVVSKAQASREWGRENRAGDSG